jgi:drug/metabolite transporter (DMT)-like permease
LTTIALALIASLFIGASDFLGGTVSRTRDPLETSLVLFLGTLVTLVPFAVVLGASDLTLHDLGLGAVSGLTTSIAYVGFFTAMGRGRMSIVAPISAAVTALLPAVAGLAGGNPLSTLAFGGVICALVSIPLVAYETDDDDAAAPTSATAATTAAGATATWSTARQVLVSVLCGVGFGFYFICIGHTHRSSGLWPTVATLVVAIAVTVPIAAHGGVTPKVSTLSRLAVAGGLSLGVADAALTTALQRGPLTVASVLGNLYPLITIALGVAILDERLRSWHVVGVLLAIAGVGMIAAGQ